MELKGEFTGWPFLLCMVEVVAFAVAAIIIIVKYEINTTGQTIPDLDTKNLRNVQPNGEELWWACGGKLHPKWLLALRTVAFAYMLPLLAFNVITDGLFVFYFYTQWTFTLLIAYFGIAAYVSSKGCLHHQKEKRDNLSSMTRSSHPHLEKELAKEHEAFYLIKDEDDHGGIQVPPSVDFQRENTPRAMEYTMKTLFQVSAPAVLITDSVYWFILVPYFLPSKLATNFLNVNMHGVNAIFLMGEFFLNSMPFPWFRVAYFGLWSIVYVLFQWLLHLTGVVKWWPYQFMDVSTPWAPLWYLGLITMHLACFCVCIGMARLKKVLRCLIPRVI